MRFSVRNAIKGGFDYYDAPDTVPINDDHPQPKLGAKRTKMGIPASQAARPLPPGARAAGHGDLAVGSISNGKTGSWGSGGGLPSGLGLGSLDLPCPNEREAAVAGLAFGVLAHLTTGGEEEDVSRGLLFATVGGVVGYFFGQRLCFWR